MDNTFYNFAALVKAATSHLIKIGYSPRNLDRFRKEWSLLAKYMEVNGIEDYTPMVGSQYLQSCAGNIEYQHLNAAQKSQIHNINILSDFVATGVVIRNKKKQEPALLKGEIGELMIEYIQFNKSRKNLSPLTTQGYYRILSVLFSYLDNNQIYTLSELSKASVVGFCGALDNYSPSMRNEIIRKAKSFLLYLFQNNYIQDNISEAVIKPRFIHRPKLSSFYSPDEVARILGAVNRATLEGKRDYCILLLASRLGVRSSDINSLRLSNLFWDKSMICFTQKKTKKSVELPLTAEIGNAIIDYLKNGRPITENKEIFIRHTEPYDKLTTTRLYRICTKYMKKAGIVYDSRRHGLHSLRHSLASNLLDNEIPLPVISQILGHDGTSSTKNYLRVDLASLRKCALDLPKGRKEVLL